MKERVTKNNQKGFTLVEMLVVIAMIAILVSILIPTVAKAVKKAKAATDAANLRAVLSVLNIEFLNENRDYAETKAKAMDCECKSFKGAGTIAVCVGDVSYIEVFYVDDGNAYGNNYFTAVASGETGTSTTLSALQAVYGEANVITLKEEATD